jgi:Cu/Ag efflux pump CusA
MEVTEEVEEAVAALRPGLAGVRMDSTLFRPATFLELSAVNLSTALIIGLVLMMAALFAFNWRTALISTVAVLVSLTAVVTVIYLRGAAINMMVIAGVMIALVAVIDDAIIDVENIVRRLNQHGREGDDIPVARIALAASMEMRRPVLYATLVMVLGVIPAFFLEGASQAFLEPLVSSYILALLASFLVALTITPTLSVVFHGYVTLQGGETPFAGMLRGVYSRLFAWAVRAPRPAFVVVCVLVVASVATAPLLRQESLLPEFKETDLVVAWRGSSSASHPAMSRIAGLISSELRSVPGVRNVSAHVGRAVMSDKLTSIDSGELRVSIDPTADYDATVAAIKDAVAGYPGLSPQVLTYLQAKVLEELSGTDNSLVVRVYGEDMNTLRKKAEDVNEILSRTVGIVTSEVQYPVQMPTLEIEVDIGKANRYGLKPGDVRRAATSLVSGIQVGSLFEDQKVFDVMVYGSPQTRHSVSAIRKLLIDTPSGGHARLNELADVRIVSAATVIDRDAVARRIDVTANVRGRDLAAVAAEVKRGIQELNFPLEYRAELLGEYAERLSAQERVIAFAVAAAILIFLLLQAFFGSWRLAAVTFLTLPMALLGGVLAALSASGGLVSIGSMVGFVAVLVVAVRNTTTLVSRYRHLARSDGESFGAGLVERATREQSAPILMSALAIALAILPLVFFGNIAGLELAHPMVIVVLGGLVTATVFSLVGVPAMYLLFGPAREFEFGDLSTNDVAEGEIRGDVVGT